MWNECEHRVELVASGDKAEVDNFGGEGTGLKTMLEVDWRLGETLTLVVTGIQDRAGNEPSRILQCPEEAPTRSYPTGTPVISETHSSSDAIALWAATGGGANASATVCTHVTEDWSVGSYKELC